MSQLRVRPGVPSLARYQPGMSEEEARRHSRTGRVIKLASNECSFGALPSARAAAHRAVESIERYPAGEESLVEAIAARHRLDPAQIVLGNGADAAIAMLGRAFLGPDDEVVFAWPSFATYPIIAAQQGARPVAVPLVDGTHDLDGLGAAVGGRTSLVFVCNPNNPTGTVVGRAALLRLLDGLPPHVLLVLDEAYAEYVRDPDVVDGVRELVAEGHPQVLTLRTFSKIYGLAGLRVGWAAGPPAAIDALARVRGPFDVGSVASAAAIAALADTAGVERRAGLNAAQRTRFAADLAAAGIESLPSEANFLCVRVRDGDARRAAAELLADGIVVRPLDGFGATDMLRVTIGRPSEMRTATAALVRTLSR